MPNCLQLMNTCIFDQLASNQHHHSKMNALFSPTQLCGVHTVSGFKSQRSRHFSRLCTFSTLLEICYGSHNCVNTTTSCSLKTPRLRSPNPHTYQQDATLQDRPHCEENQCLNQTSCHKSSVSVASVESSDQVLRCQEPRSQMIMAVLPMIQPFCQPCCQLLF